MDKDTFYFQHDYEPTSDPKIQALIGEHGAEGYGIFWRIIEMLHSNREHKLPFKNYIYSSIATQLHTKLDKVQEIVQNSIEMFELFDCDETFFWSERVNRNIERRKEISNKRSHAGRESGRARKKKKDTKIIDINEHMLNKC